MQALVPLAGAAGHAVQSIVVHPYAGSFCGTQVPPQILLVAEHPELVDAELELDDEPLDPVPPPRPLELDASPPVPLEELALDGSPPVLELAEEELAFAPPKPPVPGSPTGKSLNFSAQALRSVPAPTRAAQVCVFIATFR